MALGALHSRVHHSSLYSRMLNPLTKGRLQSQAPVTHPPVPAPGSRCMKTFSSVVLNRTKPGSGRDGAQKEISIMFTT